LRRVLGVDDAELVLVVAEAKLDVGGVFGIRAFEVGGDAKQLGVPRPRLLEIIRPKADGGEPS
jgi:hypothetical protein